MMILILSNFCHVLSLCSVCIVLSASPTLYAKGGGVANEMEAQQQAKVPITGTIVDATGEPLIGVSVMVKGTQDGSVTDVDGNYTINADPNATLIFTYIGFTSQTIALKGKTKLELVLQEQANLMKEVVVVGYGVQKKENLTGAVSSVRLDETLGSRPIADVGRGLQGAVPGLSVSIPSGEVGSDPIMKIRGQVGSIEGDNKPLVLVDNVEIPSIQMINPDDIESISVLKDAASASIYGSKAAYGVVLITTKKGAKTESFNITYSGNFSWQNPAKKINMAGIDGLEYTLEAQENRKGTMPAGGFWRLNRESFAKMKEWQEMYGGSVGATDPVVYGRDWSFNGTDKYGYRIYDPAKVMIEEWTPTQTHNLSVNGRSGKTSYNIGLGYVDQNGMMKPAKHDDFKRYNASASVTTELNKIITVHAGTLYSDRNKRYPQSAVAADPWLYMYRWSRLFPTGVEERGQPLRNPAFETASTLTSNERHKYYSFNVGTTITPVKGWDIKFDYTYASNQAENNRMTPTFTGGDIWYSPIKWKDANDNQVYVDDYGNVTQNGGQEAYTFAQSTYYPDSYIYRKLRTTNDNVFNLYTTYDLKLGGNNEHAFKFMLGSNMVKKDWEYLATKKMGLFDFKNPQFVNANGTESIENDKNWESQLGFFGRINYAFGDKYLLEANLRRDGSSNFPKHLRWRWFPSFSAGWIMTNEDFMKVTEPVLSFAKLRASWGSIGNQNVPNDLYFPVLKSAKSPWIDSKGSQFYGFGSPSAISRDITWETVETLNLGLDLRFIKDKLGVSFDWFQRETKDMIVGGAALPTTFGADVPKGNYGNMRTRGWELVVDFNHRFDNGLAINLSGTLSDATTYITKGADHNLDPNNRLLSNNYSTGRRYGDIYGYETDRLYQRDDFVYDAAGKHVQTYIILNGTQKLTNVLAGSNPVYQTYFEDGNQVLLMSPGDVKFVDLNGDGHITPGDGTVGNPGDQKVIGNSTPRFEYGFRLGLDYKGFDFSAFFQGVGKRKIWGAGQLAIPGYNAKEGAMPQAMADNFWKTDRTDAFYPRAWDLGGENTGYTMQKQSRYILNMAYLRVKNITFGYSVPTPILSRVKLQKARVYVSLENFLTFDKLRGLPVDPESISGNSMFATDGDNYNLGRTGTGAPIFKSASFGVQLTF